jgi:hypothetical protein
LGVRGQWGMGGREGGEVLVWVQRWAASLDLKESRDSAATTS